MAKSVQLHGAEDVLSAYENWGLPSWSFWEGTQFLNRYPGKSIQEGKQLLLAWMEMIGSTSQAIYTLRVYENPNGEPIKANTVYDGSVNFKLNTDQQTVNGQTKVTNIELNQRLDRIEQLLQGEEVEEEPEKDTMAKMKEFFEMPVISGLLSKFIGAPIAPAAIAGIPEDQKISQALEILKQKDPKIADHLYKLAQIALHNPMQFKLLTSSLDSMQ